MPERLSQTFARLKAANQAAFVAYLCAGDPDLPRSRAAVTALVAAGADIIELGLPFSDPLADGATNQAAADRALRAGTTTKSVLELVAQVRADHPELPLVLFTYLNPVYTYGYARFLEDAAAAGADGILLLDLPPDEAAHNPELLTPTNLATIRLIAPSTPPARRRQLAESAEGFIYYVAREGVTGEQSELAADLAEQLADLRQVSGDTPICVGFGISNPAQAATVAAQADGVVVGSAIVRQIAEHGQAPDFSEKLQAFVEPLARASHERS